MKWHDVIVSLASNMNQRENLQEARRRLQQILSDISFSQELWTEPISTSVANSADTVDGNAAHRLYLNQLAWAKTSLGVEQLTQVFKQIEMEMGRTAELRKQHVVTIDLDLLEHDGQRYHLADWNRAYVTELMDSQHSA